MSNLSAALDYLRPIAASATVGKYPEHLATLIAAVERLQAERDEGCALRDENARLRADLDAGFAASDHLSAYSSRVSGCRNTGKSRPTGK